jgi:hypothetical protein
MLLIVLTLCMAVGASAEEVNYSWEDDGTVLGIYPDPSLPSIIATNITEWSEYPVYSGNFGLMLEHNETSEIPHVHLAYFWFIEDGDEITVEFYRYDDTPGTGPAVRIWGHWNDELPGNPDGNNGDAGGNDDFGPGTGWDSTSYTWTGTDGHTGLVVVAEVYSEPGDAVWLDDLHITTPDHVYIQIPGCSATGDVDGTWGSVKALYR